MKNYHIAILFFAWASPCLTSANTPKDSEIIQIGSNTFQVEWFERSDFTDPCWRENWAFEGNSEVSVEDGWLTVGKADDSIANVFTGWLRRELPRDIFIRMKAKTRKEGSQNACNLNLFIHARESDGGPLRFNRSGDYPLYHEIPNYIVTLTGGIQPGWSRVRLNPGFNLLNDRQDCRSEPGRVYELVIALNDDRLRYFIDGELIHDVEGFTPLRGGYLGLRTWNSYVGWRDIEIGRLHDLEGPN